MSLIAAPASLLVEVVVKVVLFAVVVAPFAIALSPVAPKDTHSLLNSTIVPLPGPVKVGVETKEQKLANQISKMCDKFPNVFNVKQIKVSMEGRPNPEALKTVLY